MKHSVITVLHTYRYLLLLFIIGIGTSTATAKVVFNVTKASCHGKKDGKIDVDFQGKNGPYSFLWSDGSTEDHLHDIGEGTYHLTITDKNGCIFEESVVVEVLEDKPQIKLSGGGDKTFCDTDENQDIELTAEYSNCKECELLWSTGSTEEKITISSEGDYKVTATDSAGCYKSDSTEIKIETKDCEDDDDDDDNTDVDVDVVGSKDPNDIVGPVGVGIPKWISDKEQLNYTIHFENDPDFATAPAQRVSIHSPLDPHLNIYSFRLGSFGFGDFVFEVPENSTFYTQRLDVSDSLSVVVEVIAGIDVVKKEAFWIFESRNPTTGNQPSADLGFLLVNDSLRRGEGFVSFTIIPDKQSNTGDTVHAMANIVFDQEKALATPKIFNTIDAVPPQSSHEPTYVVLDSIYSYKVTAKDDYGLGGSGVKEYDLYLADGDGSNFSLYASHIPVDSILLLKGDPRKKYCAYTIARDWTGNQESKTVADDCFSPLAKPFVSFRETAAKASVCQGAGHTLAWTSYGIDSLNIYISENQGLSFSTLATKVPAQDKSYYWQVPYETSSEKEYVIKIASVHTDTLFDLSAPIDVIAHIPAQILSSKGTSVCSGDSAVLNVLSIYSSYLWSTGNTKPEQTTKTAGSYSITVQDASGCSSSDTLNFVVHRFTEPLISPTGPYKICVDKPITLTAPARMVSYTWSTGDTLQQIIVKTSGKVALSVQDNYGCKAQSDSIIVEMITDPVECEALQVHQANIAINTLIQVAPNPVTDLATFQILLPQSQFINLKIFDSKGVEVAELYKGNIVGGTTTTIPFRPSETLSNGLYIYKLMSDQGEITNGKIVVNR